MNELVTQNQADLLFTLLPLVGVVLGAVMALAARRKNDKRAAFAAVLGWGVPLVLVGVLWRVYNAVTERLGLDTVVNLAANAALFIVVGVVCGVVWARLAAADTTSPIVAEHTPDKVKGEDSNMRGDAKE